MNRRSTRISRCVRMGLTALAAGALAPLALAQNPYAQPATPSGALAAKGGTAFTLSQQMAVENLSYAQQQQLRICNQTGNAATAVGTTTSATPLTEQPLATHAPIPVGLLVNYDGNQTSIEPGHCANVLAAQLEIRPAQPLGADVSIIGTVELVNPPVASADTDDHHHARGAWADEHETLRQLSEEIAQDDRTMRAATVELDQARHDLNDATRKLQAIQVSSAGSAPVHEATSDTGTSPR